MSARIAIRMLGLALCIGTALPALARDWSVGPAEGADFTDLAAALKSGRPEGGDRLLLLPGRHGKVNLSGLGFDTPLTITSAPEGRAHLESLWIAKSHGLTIADVDIWPPGEIQSEAELVRVDAESHDIALSGLDIRGAEAAADYYDWDRDDWLTRHRVRGVWLQGPDQSISDSTLTGISNGIVTTGDRAQVIGNEIRGFSKDGMRGFGDGSVFRGNTVRDCVAVDENHDDGFQAWNNPPKDGAEPDEIRDITLEANRILEWTGPADHPLRCTLQGFGLFRGVYREWTIVNNVIAVSAFHGIALYGSIGSKVINNTVVNAAGQPADAPWIVITDSPGVPSRDNIVVNNTAMSLRGALRAGDAARRNLVTRYPARVYADVAQGDYRPAPGGQLVDAADPAYAPDRDIDGRPRPQGAAPDLGAYELP